MFGEIQLKLPKNNEKSVEKLAHFVPAAIEGEGKINIEQHFDLYTRHRKDGLLSNALRGRPLVGERISLPTSSGRAFILQKNSSECDNASDLKRHFQSVGVLSELTYWSYDGSKENMKNFKNILEFPYIAQVVSESIGLIISLEKKVASINYSLVKELMNRRFARP